MNIAQTRQVLTYLWATHPSARKTDDDSKTAIIASYFRVLCKFDVNDVLDAVDRMCRESTTFIPSAYEIEAKCTKRININAVFPKEEYESVKSRMNEIKSMLNDLRDEYQEARSKAGDIRCKCIRCVMARFDGEIKAKELAEYKQQLLPYTPIIDKYLSLEREYEDLKKQLQDMRDTAALQATEIYDQRQKMIAQKDLKALGYACE